MAEIGPARIVVQKGPYPNQDYRLAQDRIVIGRGASCNIIFPDPEISRQHARLIQDEDGRFSIQDLGSTNGTFVNGRRISGKTLLRDGDAISLSESIVLTFLQDDPEGTGPIPDMSEAEAAAMAAPTPDTPAAPTPPPAEEAEMDEGDVMGDMFAAPDAAPAPPPPPEADAGPLQNRRFLLGCVGGTLLFIVLCLALLFFLDAYQGGRLLYCGPLRPLFELILGPFGFNPICG
jgi:predicted component of type VI protein secretion system